MITYKPNEDVRVLIDGKHAGTIFKLSDDAGAYWQYWPGRWQYGRVDSSAPVGEKFRSLELCQQSLG